MKFVTYLNVREGHEVLADVNNKLVHEGRCNVQTIYGVVQVVSKLCNHKLINKAKAIENGLYLVERTEREKDEQKLI